LTVFLTAISALLIRTLTRKQQNYEKLWHGNKQQTGTLIWRGERNK
jgi:hypothetical protein